MAAARKKAAARPRAGKATAPVAAVAPVAPVAVAPVAMPEISPLDVMLGAMRELWARAEALRGRPECEEERLGLIRQASGEAHKAAVYVHPRIASIDVEGEGGGVAAAASEGVRAMGSREVARRLLFAVAVAEHLPAVGGGNFPGKETEKEKT